MIFHNIFGHFSLQLPLDVAVVLPEKMASVELLSPIIDGFFFLRLLNFVIKVIVILLCKFMQICLANFFYEVGVKFVVEIK